MVLVGDRSPKLLVTLLNPHEGADEAWASGSGARGTGKVGGVTGIDVELSPLAEVPERHAHTCPAVMPNACAFGCAGWGCASFSGVEVGEEFEKFCVHEMPSWFIRLVTRATALRCWDWAL